MRCLSVRRWGGAIPFPALLVLVLAGWGQVQAKPNFSGTWTLNKAKSDYGPLPAPTQRTDKITHEDPSLKVTVSQSGDQGEFTYDLAYTTDGAECSNTVRDNPMKSTLKWDGDKLVFTTKGKFGGEDYTSVDSWTLSEDGKTLTILRHLTSSMGEADIRLVMEKK